MVDSPIEPLAQRSAPRLGDLPLFKPRKPAGASRAPSEEPVDKPLASLGQEPGAVHPMPGVRVDGDPVDWGLVKQLRHKASDLLTARTKDRPGISDDESQAIGRSIVDGLLRDHVASQVRTGGRDDYDASWQAALVEAVVDSLFGLGRLQPFVDDPEIENIEIFGHDEVTLEYADGQLKHGPPVADSDEDLISFLSFLAARRSHSGERPFSSANPHLDLTLQGMHRLVAMAFVTPRPVVVIRRHRLTDIALPDLVDLGTLPPSLAGFLAAAVRAKKSIIVAGEQSAGKTTMLRALANEMDAWERIGTIETEYELHLEKLPGRHLRIVPMEARPGSGERGPDGRGAGEITVHDLLYASLRMNLSRVIVGEVRGHEIMAMFKAMASGAGSLSTTHAHSARAAIERLVTAATETGVHAEHAYRQVGDHIDLVVYLKRDLITSAGSGGRRHRYVAEVIAVEPGPEGIRPAVTDVFKITPSGVLEAHTMPPWLDDLAEVGFDVDALRRTAQGAQP